MKGRSEEKIEIGKTNEKNQRTLYKETKPQNPLNILRSSRKATEEVALPQYHMHATKLGRMIHKSGSVETNNTRKADIFNYEEYRKNPDLLPEKKNLYERIKKYKSLDEVTSKVSVNPSAIVTKVTDSSMPFVNKKSSSKIQVFVEKLKYDLDRNNSNLFSLKPKPKDSSIRAVSPGKSISFDSLKFSSSLQLPKTLSAENSKDKTSDNKIGSFNVCNRSYNKTTEAIHTRNLNRSSFEKKFVPPQKVFAASTLCAMNSSNNSSSCYTNCRIASKDEPTFGKSTLESLRRREPPSLVSATSTMYARKSSDNCLSDYTNCRTGLKEPTFGKSTLESIITTKPLNPDTSKYNAMKKTREICHCLHFHTEDGIKKISPQNGPNAKELVQKFFRVNYFTKRFDEDEDEGRIELVEKGTSPPDLDSTTDVKSPTAKQNAFGQKVAKKVSPVKLKTGTHKVHPKIQKRHKVMPRDAEQEGGHSHDPEKGQALKKSMPPQKQHTNVQKSVATKMKKRPVRVEKKTSEATFKKCIANETKPKGEALDDLEVIKNLEKVFLKLNSVESSKCEKLRESSDEKDLLKIAKKKKGTDKVTDKDSIQLLLDIKQEEQHLLRRRELRNAIIRQLRNWVDADIKEI